jgi:hypothetical protein
MTDELENGTWIALSLIASGPIDTRDVESLAKLVSAAAAFRPETPSPEVILGGFRALSGRGLVSVAGAGIALDRSARRELAHLLDTAQSRSAAWDAVQEVLLRAPRRCSIQAPHPAPERLAQAIALHRAREDAARSPAGRV